MLALLEKTRMINKLLQNTEVISYKKMAEVLKDVIKANRGVRDESSLGAA